MRGGSRPNAGRKPGGKNRVTVEKEKRAIAIYKKAEAEGILPLEVMLTLMREEWDSGNKSAAALLARDAAPYCHAKLSSVEVGGDPDRPLETVTRIELIAPSLRHVHKAD